MPKRLNIDEEGIPEKIWSMWPSETAAAFNAFKAYVKCGPRRSQKKAFEYLKKNGTPETYKQIGKWMRKYKWRVRAEAWDAYRDEIEQEEFLRETKRMARRHARIAQDMQAKIMKRLKEINPTELTPDQLIRWFEVTTKVERLSANKPTAHIRSDDESDKTSDLKDLSDKDLRKLEEIMMKMQNDNEDDDDDY